MSRRFSGSFPPLMLLSHPFLMCWLDQCCQHHRLPFVISELRTTFCHVVPLYAIIMSASIISPLISLRKNVSPIKTESHYNLPLQTGFPIPLLLHVSFFHEQHLIDWLLRRILLGTLLQVLPFILYFLSCYKSITSSKPSSPNIAIDRLLV